MRIQAGKAMTSVAVALTLSLTAPSAVRAQNCDLDGVAVEFQRASSGGLELQDVKTREIAGRNRPDDAVSLGSAPDLETRSVGSVLHVQGLDESGYPDGGLYGVQIDRFLPNIWEANFPVGLYEFRRKSDLRVEVTITVAEGEALHITDGAQSAVTLQVQEGMIHELWWGGTNSLKRLRGNLEFTYSDIQKLSRAGVHRANLTVCINVRGHL